MTRRPFSQLALSAARWPPAAALAGLIVFGAVLPERYGLLPPWASGPMWLMVLALVFVSTFAHASPRLRRIEGHVTLGLLAVVTGLLILGVVDLVVLALTESSTLRGLLLLSTGAALWTWDIVVFALWYWLLDRGGPELRLRGAPGPVDFQFPRLPDAPEIAPRFVDYIFLAFNTSISFSPTDTAPMTARAKLLMMTQAILSLVTLVVVVARAVNVLD
jgi:uncharacterized membrane protein